MKQKADLIGNNTAYCISDLLCFQKKTVPAYWTNTIPLWVRQEKLPSQFLILNLNLWNMTYAPLKIAFASIASKAETLMSFQKCLFQRRKIIEASFSHCSHSYQFSNTPKRKCYKKLHNLFSLNQSEILLIFFFLNILRLFARKGDKEGIDALCFSCIYTQIQPEIRSKFYHVQLFNPAWLTEQYITEKQVYGQDKCSIISPKILFHSPADCSSESSQTKRTALIFTSPQQTHANFQHSEHFVCRMISYCLLLVLNWPLADFLQYLLNFVLGEKISEQTVPCFCLSIIFSLSHLLSKLKNPPLHPQLHKS